MSFNTCIISNDMHFFIGSTCFMCAYMLDKQNAICVPICISPCIAYMVHTVSHTVGHTECVLLLTVCLFTICDLHRLDNIDKHTVCKLDRKIGIFIGDVFGTCHVHPLIFCPSVSFKLLPILYLKSHFWWVYCIDIIDKVWKT